MSLAPGTRIGSYEITSAIGSGGMGEVYRARDTRLKRDVALKILPDTVASDRERLVRFEREAEVLAALNHPHIAQIYGLEWRERQEGQEKRDGLDGRTGPVLVLELVEGDDLAARIARGPISLDEALPIARQIADALDAAHERGIIHRDLKPANIKVRDDGTVKVLDFGLAKALEGPGKAGHYVPDVTQSPTITSPAMTAAGMILGTAAYMAPEQAKGRPLDKRADIWAFGCVLYEMLTGRRPFPGDDVSDTLASILKSEPDWSALPAATPAALRRLLRRCLEKDRRQRLADIADARLDLDEARTNPAEASVAAVGRSSRRRSLSLLAVFAAGAAAASLAAMFLLRTPRPSPGPVTRLTVALPRSSSEFRELGDSSPSTDIAISPDGRFIAYTVGRAGQVGGTFADVAGPLYLRSLDQLDARQVAETATGPFFSPDSQWIGFADGPNLKKALVAGGPAIVIGPVPEGGRNAAWGADGTIVYGKNYVGLSLLRPGGAVEVLTTLDTANGETEHNFPSFLPRNRAILFTIHGSDRLPENAQVAVLDLVTRQRRVLFKGHHARFASPGQIVYGLNASLFAVPFDPDRLELKGNPVPVVDGVLTKAAGAIDFAVSSTGVLAYVTGDAPRTGRATLVWVDRQGREEPIAGLPARPYRTPRLSPDGLNIAVDIRDRTSDIWVWNFARQTLAPVTRDPDVNRGVAWSSNGEKIAFSVQRNGTENIYWQKLDGTGTAERLTTGSRPQLPMAFTPDGAQLLFTEPGSNPGDIGLAQLPPNQAVRLILRAKFDENNPAVSPNGKWLAYDSDESGMSEVYVRPFPDVDSARWPISTNGGTRPVWASNGRELFYYQRTGRIVSVDVLPGPTFAPGASHVLFSGVYMAPATTRHYDVSADGQRFLMTKEAPPENAAPPQLVVVMNWIDELKRLAPQK